MTAKQSTKPAEASLNFEVGTRCRLSELGKSRSPKLASKVGSVYRKARTKTQVHLLLDGNKTRITLHRSYVERIPADEDLVAPFSSMKDASIARSA
jgi:hypothetical protein